MPRIHVTGAPGAGKTTYARKLATAQNLPLCHLDKIYHDNSGCAPRNRRQLAKFFWGGLVVKLRLFALRLNS